MTVRVPMAAVIAEASAREVRVDARQLAAGGSARLALRPIDVYRLIGPYLSVRFRDQFRAVAPLAAYLVLFQLLILRRGVEDGGVIAAGLLAAVLGLAVFLEGLRLGIMPFAESLGSTLPARAPLGVVLVVTFTLGVGVTFAEPAVGALQAAGALVDPARSPLLAMLLGPRATWLVLSVGAGVGVAAILGTLRFVKGWSLKPLIVAVALPTLALTTIFAFHPRLASIVGLAWDCGAVTTGPVTVPLVLALGIGVATSVGKGSTPLAGFGIVTIASLLPVLAVLVLGGALEFAGASGAAVAATAAAPGWHQASPGVDVVLGLRAVLPLAFFLLLLLRFVAKERVRDPRTLAFGVFLATAGMIVFNLGISYGLARLGGQSGELVPGTFARVAALPASPLWPGALGVAVAVLFAGALGFGATIAEPALAALGVTVENLTNGALRRRSLVRAVALGVGGGLALGALRATFDIPLAAVLVPAYVVALALTFLSSEEFVNVAWDSAGVTTGPVTVPLVLAMGLGFGGAIGGSDGFGMLALASIGPIVSVLAAGLLAQARSRRNARRRLASIAQAAA
jgi:hypothetical protein